MAAIDTLRNNIINKLLTISNKNYLFALNNLIESSSLDTNPIELTKEQILMLELSDKDIKNGKLISAEKLDKEDLKWLKEL